MVNPVVDQLCPVERRPAGSCRRLLDEPAAARLLDCVGPTSRVLPQVNSQDCRMRSQVDFKGTVKVHESVDSFGHYPSKQWIHRLYIRQVKRRAAWGEVAVGGGGALTRLGGGPGAELGNGLAEAEKQASVMHITRTPGSRTAKCLWRPPFGTPLSRNRWTPTRRPRLQLDSRIALEPNGRVSNCRVAHHRGAGVSVRAVTRRFAPPAFASMARPELELRLLSMPGWSCPTSATGAVLHQRRHHPPHSRLASNRVRRLTAWVTGLDTLRPGRLLPTPETLRELAHRPTQLPLRIA
jgi:hypothetical protein